MTGAGRTGTRVAERPALALRIAAPVPEGVRDLADGNPDPALLPRLAPRLGERVLYGEEQNDPALVEAAGAELTADGIPSEALAVVGGALDGIERVLAAQLNPGDRVAVEDPCFTRVLDLLGALRLDPVPVAVDGDGPRPDSLAGALERGVSALVITPRAQNPTGAALDAARAAELQQALHPRPEVLVVEDDHAGSIAGARARTLVRDRQTWAVIRSFAKALGPDLRVALLAGDAETVARVRGRQMLGTGWVSRILQRTVADELVRPATRRLLEAAAAAYAERRTALLDELRERGVAANGRSGLNVWVPVTQEAAVVQALVARGYAVAPGERFRIASPPAIRVTIARLGSRDAPACAAAIADAAAPVLPPYAA